MWILFGRNASGFETNRQATADVHGMRYQADSDPMLLVFGPDKGLSVEVYDRRAAIVLLEISNLRFEI